MDESKRNDLGILLASKHKLIVKPSEGADNRGVSANIETCDQLHAAIREAARISSHVLVQEQIEV